MAKEKKQNFMPQGKSNKNIRKEIPNNQRGKDNNKFTYNQRPQPDNKRQGLTANIREIQVQQQQPKLKLGVTNSSSSNGQSPYPPSNMQTSVKKINILRPDQILNVQGTLVALQKLLNSYDELQMDKSSNVRFLIDSILQKKLNTE